MDIERYLFEQQCDLIYFSLDLAEFQSASIELLLASHRGEDTESAQRRLEEADKKLQARFK